MTPIVKLVFGVDYDKTRLTEFAAALSYAERENVDFGGFQEFVEQAEGGLKGLVAAERKARRPDKPAEDKLELGKAALRAALPLASANCRPTRNSRWSSPAATPTECMRWSSWSRTSAMLDRALRRAARYAKTSIPSAFRLLP